MLIDPSSDTHHAFFRALRADAAVHAQIVARGIPTRWLGGAQYAHQGHPLQCILLTDAETDHLRVALLMANALATPPEAQWPRAIDLKTAQASQSVSAALQLWATRLEEYASSAAEEASLSTRQIALNMDVGGNSASTVVCQLICRDRYVLELGIGLVERFPVASIGAAARAAQAESRGGDVAFQRFLDAIVRF